MAVRIHPTAVVEPQAQLGERVDIGPLCYVGPKAVIGDDTRLVCQVSILNRTTLGAGNIIWPNAVLGADPQDLKFFGEDSQLIIGDNNTFRENCTVHIGTDMGGGATRIGHDNMFMASSHIAHDCIIGNHVLLANAVLVAGHVHISDYAVISGGTALHHFVTVGHYAFLGGMTRIVHDCPPYMIVEGNPSKVRGVNKIGLERRKFTEEQINVLKEAYRRLYRNGEASEQSLDDAMTSLQDDYPGDDHITELIGFARKMMAGAHGRYREALRTDDKKANPVK